MWNARKGLVALAVIVVLVVATVVAWPFVRTLGRTPGCIVTAAADAASGAPVTFPLSGEQAQNAATIAAIGMRLGMPGLFSDLLLGRPMRRGYRGSEPLRPPSPVRRPGR